MRKITAFLSLAISAVTFHAHAQYVLYGATSGGGTGSYGTIFNYNIKTGAYNMASGLGGANGATPYYGAFTLDTANGLLYRTVYGGGLYGYGAIVSYGACAGENAVAAFNTNLPDGSVPYGNLTYCSANGLYYGMTEDGGANNDGVLFAFNPLNNKDSILLNFNGAGNGSLPDGSPTYDPVTGLIYGMTSQGGANNVGVLFSYNIVTGKDSVLVTFNTTNGANPYGTLFFNSMDSLLYGMTNVGGANSFGVLFSYNTATGKDSVRVNFDGTNGGYPNGTFVFNPLDSLLYGMTSSGGINSSGNIFSYNRKTGTCTLLYSFSGTDGASPFGTLMYNPLDSLLYGMTNSGGTGNAGVLFSYNTRKAKDSVRLNFNSLRESQPDGDLVLDPADSLLYGMTQNGGTNSLGVVFSFNTRTNKDSVLVNLNDTNGAFPWGALVYNASNGLLYGMTSNGGNNSNGLIFSYNPVTKKDNVAYAFRLFNSGTFPQNGGLTYNPGDSLYYGMTTSGGTSDVGTLFRFNPLTGRDSILLDFNGLLNGSSPHGNLIYHAGWFYGMTTTGGVHSLGTVFRFNPATGKDTILINFNDTVGANPYGSLMYDNASGLFYGMASAGGKNADGTIFTYNMTTGKDSVVYNFSGADGQAPYGSLTRNAVNGLLYGMTSAGGANGKGTVFSFNPATEKDSVILSFNGTNGGSPYGDVTFNAAGNTLYGMAFNGGANNQGVLFNINITNGKDSTLLSYNGSNGSFPRGSLSLINISLAATVSKDTAVCPGASVTLTASTPSNGSYTWSTGATTSSITVSPLANSTFSVTICKGVYLKDTTITITITKPTINITAALNGVCAGMKDTLTGSATGNGPFTYSWSNGSSSDTAVVSGGSYSLTVTDVHGCKNTDTSSVTTKPLPVVTVTGKDTILKGSTDTLTASGGVSYVWTSGSSSDTTKVTPSSTATYTVTATGANGCTDTASFRVIVNLNTSIASSLTSTSTSLYPNPAVQTMYLSFNMNGTEAATITVMNAEGVEIMHKNASISNGQVMPVDISALAPGVYFVRVIISHATQTIRFIKQ